MSHRDDSGVVKISSALLLIMLCLTACTDDESVANMSLSTLSHSDLIEDYSEDARVLAARSATSPWIDPALVAEIEAVLTKTRPLRPEFGAIHAFKDYDLHDLIISARPALASILRRGELITGDAYLDSLSAAFRLTQVDSLFGNIFVLTYKLSLSMPYVAELYEASPQVIYAEVNGYGGDGDRIWAFKKSERWHIVYSEGRDDCPSGCIWRSVYYVELPPGGQGMVVDERVPGGPPPSSKITRWNIPGRYSVTLFRSLDALFSSFDHRDWWVRRHAIEASWRLFVNGSPTYGEDIGETWQVMHREIRSRRTEYVSRLRGLLSDPDTDVQQSAALALAKVTGTGR